MKIAVFGAAGRTGTATVRAARSRGHEVMAVARRKLDDLPADVESAVADVTDADEHRHERSNAMQAQRYQNASRVAV